MFSSLRSVIQEMDACHCTPSRRAKKRIRYVDSSTWNANAVEVERIYYVRDGGLALLKLQGNAGKRTDLLAPLLSVKDSGEDSAKEPSWQIVIVIEPRF